MIKRGLMILVLTICGSFGLAAANTSIARACGEQGMILTLKPWYYGLAEGGPGDCTIPTPQGVEEQRAFVWTIVLNIVENLIQIAGFVAVGFVIYGGFLFMTSTGEPDKAASARKTITRALIGAAAAGSAVVLVNLVARTALGIN